MAMTMKQVQNLLQYLGYYEGIPDDEYGPLTRDATFDFQVAYGTIGVDGIPGPETEAALIDAVATGKYFKSAPEEPPEQPEEEPDSSNFWADIKYFKREEFRCKCGGKYCDGFPVEPDKELVELLEKIRNHFGAAVTVTSGVRCKTHNSSPAVGGATNSQHLYGTAADIKVKGVAPEKVAAYAETLLPQTGGIGRYETFTHVDVRSNKSRWNG